MKNIDIQNTQACFVQLWLRLELTRLQFKAHYRRYCLRHVLQAWFGSTATDDFIWEVCNCATLDEEPVYGYDTLPPPSLHPRVHREILRAIVQVTLGLKIQQVRLKALDKAYSIAFPLSTPINIEKKKRKKRRYYVKQKH